MCLAACSVTYLCSAWTSSCPCGWSHLALSLIMCHDHLIRCMFDNIFDYVFDPTAPFGEASFWNERSSISAICANVLFVFQPSLGSRRKKALGFENIQSPWCSSFDICITMCRTSFPCGWVQSSCVRWQQQCFLSTYDLTLRWYEIQLVSCFGFPLTVTFEDLSINSHIKIKQKEVVVKVGPLLEWREVHVQLKGSCCVVTSETVF